MKLFLSLYFIELCILILYSHSLQHKDTTYFRICKILIKKFQKKEEYLLGYSSINSLYGLLRTFYAIYAIYAIRLLILTLDINLPQHRRIGLDLGSDSCRRLGIAVVV